MGKELVLKIESYDAVSDPPTYELHKGPMTKEAAELWAKKNPNPYELECYGNCGLENGGHRHVHSLFRPTEETAVLYARNPIMCGFIAFQLALDMERAGLNLESMAKYIFHTAHLYYAILQNSTCQQRWPALDKIMRPRRHLCSPVTYQKPRSRYLLDDCYNWASVRLI